MPRIPVCVRLSQSGIDRLDTLATEAGVTRSTALRVLMGESLKDQRLVDRVRATLTRVAEAS